MSAEVLRQAAALMRERAEAVPVDGLGDWWFDVDASDLMHLRRHDREQVVHFGHPAVALAVADWLDKEAEGFALIEATLRIAVEIGAEATVKHSTHEEALAVAHAYLGSDQ